MLLLLQRREIKIHYFVNLKLYEMHPVKPYPHFH